MNNIVADVVISSRTHTAPLLQVWSPGTLDASVSAQGELDEVRRKGVHFRDKLLPTMWAFPL